jgi:SAM-dependent methyltransferase
MNDFTRFFGDKNYILLKNYLFNYLNRKRLIKFYSSSFIQNGKIIDVGSGISPISPKPNKTHFIDISKDAVKVMKKRGFNASNGSVTNLKLETGSTSNIFCSEVLEHVEDYQKALKEFSRVLKKGGYLFITVPCWMHYWRSDDDFVGHYRRFDPDSFEKDFIKCGLKPVTRRKIGSAFERNITLFLVNNFKKTGKLNPILVPFYIVTYYALSWLVTFSSFFTSEKKASIILFIAKKD